MTPQRSRLDHARADKRVYCHEALHMQAKLQRAGYEQKAVKWDSDSDSDETDEEDMGGPRCLRECGMRLWLNVNSNTLLSRAGL